MPISTPVKKYITLNIDTQMISRKIDSSPTLVYAPDRYCKQNSHQTHTVSISKKCEILITVNQMGITKRQYQTKMFLILGFTLPFIGIMKLQY